MSDANIGPDANIIALIDKEVILEIIDCNLSPKTKAELLLNPRIVPSLREMEPVDREKFLDFFYHAFPTLDSETVGLVGTLGEICGQIPMLPPSAILPTVKRSNTIPDMDSTVGDRWPGHFGDNPVFVDVVRQYVNHQSIQHETMIVVWERVPTWMKLRHPNILKFLGVVELTPALSLVYSRGGHGHITDYISSNHRVSRPHLVLDIAKGLQYLHNLNIPHGGLSVKNILIDEERRACLSEYGLGFGLKNGAETVWTARLSTYHEQALESIYGVKESKKADMYAFGVVAVHVLTDVSPFEGIGGQNLENCKEASGPTVIPKDIGATGLTGKMWNLLQRCLNADPEERPTIHEVVEELESSVGDSTGLSNDAQRVVSAPEPFSSHAMMDGQ